MRTVGLIVEYNPFHNGHLYHLQQSQKISEADAVVAVMSGHFLQRGEPALMDKWTRAQSALEGGCDLVIELPVAYATQAAEWFGYGAVSLLEATGVVDAFCFGTESGELAPLWQAAKLVAHEPAAFKEKLKMHLAAGIAYPGAYSAAISEYLAEQGYASESDFAFAQPNHTLGLHYLIALERISGKMEPLTIRREKSQYSQQFVSDANIASATAIRKLLADERRPELAEPLVPATTYRLLSEQWDAGLCPITWDHFTDPLLHSIVTRTREQLSELHDITEGLEHRIGNLLPKLQSFNFEELLQALKTKRYTRTKLQRALLAVLLGHRKADFTKERLQAGIQYIRVLGFTDKGRQLLRRMRSAAKLPVLLSAAQAEERYPYLELDIRASGVYMLAQSNKPANMADLFRDYRDKPIYV